jgi:hypothetical protein
MLCTCLYPSSGHTKRVFGIFTSLVPIVASSTIFSGVRIPESSHDSFSDSDYKPMIIKKNSPYYLHAKVIETCNETDIQINLVSTKGILRT